MDQELTGHAMPPIAVLRNTTTLLCSAASIYYILIHFIIELLIFFYKTCDPANIGSSYISPVAPDRYNSAAGSRNRKKRYYLYVQR
jgi:hypothetical protein